MKIMPKFYELPKNWNDRGRFVITPRPFYRKIKLFNALIPYKVGDQVKFHVYFEKPNLDTGGWLSHILFETISDKTKQICAVNESDTEVVGSIIDRQGDISYSIGLTMDSLNAHTIFTATVESMDTKLSKWFIFFVGVILTFICSALVAVLARLLGFIEIIPKWQMFLN